MTTKTWARITPAGGNYAAVPGTVAEVVTLDAALVPGESVFVPGLTFVDVTAIAGVAIGWTYNGTAFAAPPPVVATAAQLAAYANNKQVALRDGGIVVNVGTQASPVEVDVASDVNGRSLVTGCVQLVGLAAQNGQAAPTFQWINTGGAQLTLAAAQMMTIGQTLGSFVQATYTALGQIVAAIAAGTITSTAAIDAAAWPATSY